MTRRSRREIENAVDAVASQDDQVPRNGFTVVHRDPATGKLYDGFGEAPNPIEERPEGTGFLVQRRAVTVMRDEAERDEREIVEVVDEHSGGEVVAVRLPIADSVDTEAAMELPESELDGSTSFFTYSNP